MEVAMLAPNQTETTIFHIDLRLPYVLEPDQVKEMHRMLDVNAYLLAQAAQNLGYLEAEVMVDGRGFAAFIRPRRPF
jgi:hypothetical protein